MRSLKVYRVEVDVEDDPASILFSVLVVAWDGTEARKLARQGALYAYRSDAGGWAKKPKAFVGAATITTIPQEPAVLAVEVNPQ